MTARRIAVRSYADARALYETVRQAFARAGALRVTLERLEQPVTDDQRKLVFALCGDIAAQLAFPGGGEASAEHWYRFLIGLHRGEPMVREGQVVVIIGGGLSGATKREASDLIAFIESWGTERGVRFSAPERGTR